MGCQHALSGCVENRRPTDLVLVQNLDLVLALVLALVLVPELTSIHCNAESTIVQR